MLGLALVVVRRIPVLLVPLAYPLLIVVEVMRCHVHGFCGVASPCGICGMPCDLGPGFVQDKSTFRSVPGQFWFRWFGP